MSACNLPSHLQVYDFNVVPQLHVNIIRLLLGPLHTQGRRTMTIANEELSLVERAETVQVHFTLGGEGLKAQRKVRG
jgi:hypothetical protein